jgi:hypothetical protein
LHVHDRGAQAGAQTAACGDATLPHQEKNTSFTCTEDCYLRRRGAVAAGEEPSADEQKNREILPAPYAQRQGNPRGDVPLTRWSRWP